MANQETNQDLDLGDEKSGKKKLILIGIALLLLLAGGGVAGYFLLAGDDTAATDSADSAQSQEEAPPEVEQGPAQYYAMDPVFVVNLPGRPSLLQVGIDVRVTSDQMVDFLKHNDPMLRHYLLNLLQTKDAKTLVTRTAKEELQREMLDEINRIIKELSGPGKVDALYFTSFVMQ